jgi:branched-chain amino acid transport system substrate-binding protein
MFKTQLATGFRNAFNLFIFCCISLPSISHAADIFVGSVMSQKGPAAASGLEFLKGSKAYFDHINAKGGVNGNKIIMVTGDDGGEKGSDPDKTVSEFKRLAEQSKLVGFVNASGTPNMEALLKDGSITQAGIAVVGPFSLSNKLRMQATPNMFFIRTGSLEESQRMVRQAAAVGVSKVSLIYFDNAFGNELQSLASNQLKSLPQIKVQSILLDAKTTDMDAVAKSALADGAQMIMLLIPGRLSSAIIKSYRDQGGTAYIVAASATSADQVVREIGATKAIGVGVMQVVPLAHRTDLSLVKEYQAAMLASHGQVPPTAFSLEGYVNAKVLAEGIRRTKVVTPANVTASLRRLKGFDLGGLVVDLTDPTKSGLKFVDIGIISRDGKLRF